MNDSPKQGQPDAALPARPVRAATDNRECQTQTGTSAGGLTEEEAQRRLTQYGYNELPEKKRNPLLEFFSHFRGPIPWMIETAAILSALVCHWADFIIILVLLAANAVVGFWEKCQAGNAIAALEAHLALKARVKRDGQWLEIPVGDLMPGDLVHLRLRLVPYLGQVAVPLELECVLWQK